MFDQFIQFHKHLLNTSCVWNADGQTHGSGRYQGNLCQQGPQNLPNRPWKIELWKSNSKESQLWKFLTKLNVSGAVTGEQNVLSSSWTSFYQAGHILFLHDSISLVPAQPKSVDIASRKCWNLARAEAEITTSRSRLIPQAFIKCLLRARQGGGCRGKHDQAVPTSSFLVVNRSQQSVLITDVGSELTRPMSEEGH